mmetsp:Transcript_16196/g.19164  ORF Transcript_16196/g.19164 Transcript_16196/m.19164 type:complete len:106 (+) Transcript_16196:161-478(+)
MTAPFALIRYKATVSPPSTVVVVVEPTFIKIVLNTGCNKINKIRLAPCVEFLGKRVLERLNRIVKDLRILANYRGYLPIAIRVHIIQSIYIILTNEEGINKYQLQ